MRLVSRRDWSIYMQESNLLFFGAWFIDLFLLLGMTYMHVAYFKNDHTKSKVQGHMTAWHLILISTFGNYACAV